MKFGKSFLLHQIPEWSVFYMNYKQLKKIIKQIHDGESIEAATANFFFELDRDIEKVADFYNTKFNEYSRRLEKLVQVLGYTEGDVEVSVGIDSNYELDEIINILLELRSVIRNLKWFGELNHKGFVKILKKFDKNIAHANKRNPGLAMPTTNKEDYLVTRVNPLPFAHETELLAALDVIAALLNVLVKDEDDEDDVRVRRPKLPDSYDSDDPARFATIIEVDDAARLRAAFDREKEREHVKMDMMRKTDENDSKTDEKEAKQVGNESNPVPTDVETAVSMSPQRSTSLDSYLGRHSLSAKFLLSLLIRATLNNAQKCIDEIFKQLETVVRDGNTLFDSSDLSGRNFFHQLFVNLGKQQLIKEEKVTPGESNDLTRFIGNKGPDAGDETSLTVAGLEYVLSKVEHDPKLKSLLLTKDNYARTPLHYSAQYGLKDITKMVLQYLRQWGMISPTSVGARADATTSSIDSIGVWGDHEGLTPLHLSIIGNHPKTTANLLAANRGVKLSCPSLLLLAVRLNSLAILRSIIDNGDIDINYTDPEHNMETALYIACKHDYYNLVEYLLEHGAQTEVGECIFGWTPIFVAASEGYKQTVKLLLEYGAVYDIVDDSGWLPMEHACLRGHLEVADLLVPEDKLLLLYDAYHLENNKPRLSTTKAEGSPGTSPAISESTSIDKLPEGTLIAPAARVAGPAVRTGSPFDSDADKSQNVYKQLKTGSTPAKSMLPVSRHRIKKQIRPLKSFGHRYLGEGESLILITLGTTDLRNLQKPVELSKVSLSKTFKNELDTVLSLSVTCISKLNNEPVEPPTILDLPLEDQHGSATDPLTFKLSNHLSAEDVFITFDLIPTYGYTLRKKSRKILGRAVALLKDAYTKVGPNLRSLNNNITVPILDASNMDVLGTLRFEYLCVTSFQHSSMNIERSDTYWKQLVSTRVIGHRGLGKNDGGRKSLQLGENTVESFIAAASLGASYVEFDVQLTKDYIPVVYHDFTVAESGVDIPMHAMTAEQFLSLNEHDKGKKEKTTQKYAVDDHVLKDGRTRSLSAFSSSPNFQGARNKFSALLASTSEAAERAFDDDDMLDRELRSQFNSRMKLTKTWKDKGFKGNARGFSVASNFVTLKELFKKLPKSVGFNIELKYPMLDEAEQESMGEIAIDLNFYVDTILKVVYDENTTGRDIILLSFHPDICLLLSLKQPTMPILFLSESGTAFMADIRALSLQNAIRFAKKWNLLGIVSAAGALVKTPRLAQVVKSLGLVCVTYGTENNDPELAKIQMRAGVDAVIADSVLAVREGLRLDLENLKMLEDALSE